MKSGTDDSGTDPMGFKKNMLLQKINFTRQYSDLTSGDAGSSLPTGGHSPAGWPGEMGPI